MVEGLAPTERRLPPLECLRVGLGWVGDEDLKSKSRSMGQVYECVRRSKCKKTNDKSKNKMMQ